MDNEKDFWSKIFTKNNKNSLFTDSYSSQKNFFESGYVESTLEKLYLLANIRSLDVIYPFLDIRLVNFCFKVPMDFRLKKGITRYYFREALKEILPNEIYRRNYKSNIGPLAKIEIIKNYNDIIHELKSSPSGIINSINLGELQNLIDENIDSKEMASRTLTKLYNIYTLAKWLEKENFKYKK